MSVLCRHRCRLGVEEGTTLILLYSVTFGGPPESFYITWTFTSLLPHSAKDLRQLERNHKSEKIKEVVKESGEGKVISLSGLAPRNAHQLIWGCSWEGAGWALSFLEEQGSSQESDGLFRRSLEFSGLRRVHGPS